MSTLIDIVSPPVNVYPDPLQPDFKGSWARKAPKHDTASGKNRQNFTAQKHMWQAKFPFQTYTQMEALFTLLNQAGPFYVQWFSSGTIYTVIVDKDPTWAAIGMGDNSANATTYHIDVDFLEQ